MKAPSRRHIGTRVFVYVQSEWLIGWFLSFHFSDLSLQLSNSCLGLPVEERHRNTQSIRDPFVERGAEVDDGRLLPIRHGNGESAGTVLDSEKLGEGAFCRFFRTLVHDSLVSNRESASVDGGGHRHSLDVVSAGATHAVPNRPSCDMADGERNTLGCTLPLTGTLAVFDETDVRDLGNTYFALLQKDTLQ